MIWRDIMKEEVFYGKGMGKLKEEDEDLYQAIVALNDAVWNGKALDYKTQKLIAIGIAASNADSRATEKQIMSAKKELGVTRDEVVDVLADGTEPLVEVQVIIGTGGVGDGVLFLHPLVKSAEHAVPHNGVVVDV